MLPQSNSFLSLVLLAVSVCVVIAVDMFTPAHRSRVVSGLTAFSGGLVALLALVLGVYTTALDGLAYRFTGMLVYDQVSLFLSLLCLSGMLLAIVFAIRSKEMRQPRQGEFYALLLGATFGGVLLVSADHLLLFFLGLETMSICSYVLAGYHKDDHRSAEAGLKYLIYGAVLSGTLFFGFSYLYGLSGTLHISEMMGIIAHEIESGQMHPLIFAVVAAPVVAGLGFKMALFPFHFWCPDVYQGAPTPVTAYLSVVSKAASFGALLRVLLPFYAAYGQGDTFDPSIFGDAGVPVFIGLLAMGTMTFGNLAALRQTDIKRLMAYSSIAHAGYLLLPLTVDSPQSVEALLFYLAIYLFMNLGVFWVVIAMANQLGSAEISRLRGVARQLPFLFGTLFVFLIALTGLPPTAGFVAKFMIFKVVIDACIHHMVDGQFTLVAGFYGLLALVGVLNSAVSLYYYMRIARVMALEEPLHDTEVQMAKVRYDRRLAIALAAPLLLLLLNFTPLLKMIEFAAN
jgi:NADH-quinone oxidoreductase subunit N